MSLGTIAYVHMGILRYFNTHSNIKKSRIKCEGNNKKKGGGGGGCLHRNGRMALALTYHKFVNIKSNVNGRRRRGWWVSNQRGLFEINCMTDEEREQEREREREIET